LRRVINRRLACAVVLAGIAAAGCGSSHTSTTTSQVSFRSGFATSAREFRQLGTDIAKDITGAGNKTDAALVTEFDNLATRADQQAAQLESLHIPARYKTQVAKMVTGFHAVKNDLSNISTAAKNHNVSNAEAATRELLHDAVTIKSADVALSTALGLPGPSTSTTSKSSTSSSG
jgi:hypothetical protein